MQAIEQALEEIRSIHERLTHAPAPEIGPHQFLPFPPGVDPVAYALEEVTQLRHAVEQSKTRQGWTPSWIPRASVFSATRSVMFQIEIPGVPREEVAVHVEPGQLIVRGNRPQTEMTEGMRSIFVEQPWGGFERRFPLPLWCDAENCAAQHANGVLEVSFERREEPQAGERRVEIG